MKTEEQEYQDSVTEDQKVKDKLFDEMKAKEDDLEFFKAGVLTQCGWVRSCNCPGSFWLWVKTIKGEAISTNTAMALQIEANIIEYKN